MTQPAAPSPAQTPAAVPWRALLVSVAIAALGYLAFSLWGGWHDVVTAAVRVGLGGAAVLLSLSAINYGLRFLRWQLYLQALGDAQPWRPSLLIYLAGFALTTTPGKVGEAVRALFLKQRGVPHGHSMAAFVSERLSDLLAVLLLCSVGWSISPPLRVPMVIGMVLLAALFFVISQGPWLAAAQARMAPRGERGRPGGRLARGLQLLLQLLLAARRCHQPRVLLLATLLSVAAWAAEGFALHLLLGWLAVDASAAFAFFTYAVGMLAGALSFLPGGLGGTEATMTGLLLWHGASAPAAIAATVFIRLTTLWFAVAIGVVALARLLPTLRPKAAAQASSPAAVAPTAAPGMGPV